MNVDSKRRILPRVALVIVAALLPLLLLEVGIRLIYALRNARVEAVPVVYTVRNFGLVPPWADGLRILEPDDKLIWKGRPFAHQKYLDVFSPMPSEEERIALLRRFNPSIPAALKNNPTWEVQLNSEGFRERELPPEKFSDSLRVVCLGDSWTFGANVNEEQSYPRRLEALLRSEFPDRRVEVFNLGMLAYSSFQGLEQLEERALALQPDVVLIGFAMNDSVVAGWRDRDQLQTRPAHFGLRRFLSSHLESLKLFNYLAQVSRFESKSVGDHLKALVNPSEKFSTYEGWTSSDALEAGDYDRLESKTRVSPADFEKNIRAIVALVRRQGATPVLLHNELRPGSPYQSILQKISREEGVTLVDACALIAEARRHIESALEEKLSLQPPTVATPVNLNEDVELVFRLYMDGRRVSKAAYIVGPDAQLGDAVPNRVAMYDDGTHGDERAGDNVWTYSARFPRGAKIFYHYTESGAEGRWENLDVPKIRSATVAADAPAKLYLPIETFGKIYMQNDGWHTNAEGYELIAEAVLDALQGQEVWGRVVLDEPQRTQRNAEE